MRAIIRLCTTLVTIGLCAFTVARGWGIVHFSLAMAKADSPETRAEIVDTWRSAPDVASTALQAEVSDQINSSDRQAADRRRQSLVALVSIRPLSSYYWLSLSGLQLITDQPMEQVFDSLELSMLTGPNEGYVAENRRFFGVSLWQRLSPDLRRRVANDVAGEIHDSFRFREFASAQPEQVRNELREALRATGLSSKEIEYRLGF